MGDRGVDLCSGDCSGRKSGKGGPGDTDVRRNSKRLEDPRRAEGSIRDRSERGGSQEE